VPDRVALRIQRVQEQTRVRHGYWGRERRSCRFGDVSPSRGGANERGAENIPARYRWYIQHYFEHPESGQKYFLRWDKLDSGNRVRAQHSR